MCKELIRGWKAACARVCMSVGGEAGLDGISGGSACVMAIRHRLKRFGRRCLWPRREDEREKLFGK